MQVTIHNQPREILVQTISLTQNKNNPSNIYLFFCFRCCYQISQVQGSVARVFPGLEPSEDIPVLHKCPRCSERYVFQTKKFLQHQRAKITLSHVKDVYSTFHCFICSNPLLQYNNSLVTLLPSHARARLPLSLDCINPECPQRYTILDVL